MLIKIRKFTRFWIIFLIITFTNLEAAFKNHELVWFSLKIIILKNVGFNLALGCLHTLQSRDYLQNMPYFLILDWKFSPSFSLFQILPWELIIRRSVTKYFEILYESLQVVNFRTCCLYFFKDRKSIPTKNSYRFWREVIGR